MFKIDLFSICIIDVLNLHDRKFYISTSIITIGYKLGL